MAQGSRAQFRAELEAKANELSALQKKVDTLQAERTEVDNLKAELTALLEASDKKSNPLSVENLADFLEIRQV